VAGFSEHGNDFSGFIKCGKFLDYLKNYELYKRDSAVFKVG
jgi:hypothetical protein